MLDFICYLLALIFAALAVLAGPPFPAYDRARLLSLAFACFVVPFLVDAAQNL
jgi:uncharacterized membrane protein